RTTLMLAPGAAADGVYRVSVSGVAGGRPVSVEVPWVIARTPPAGHDTVAPARGGCASGPGIAGPLTLVAVALAWLARRRRRTHSMSAECRGDVRPEVL